MARAPTNLYLIGFKDGRIKVGQSRNIRARIATHRSTHRDQFDWAHIFALADSGLRENLVKYAMEQKGRRIGRTEMFSGLSKSQAIEIARMQLRLDPDEQRDFLRAHWNAIRDLKARKSRAEA